MRKLKRQKLTVMKKNKTEVVSFRVTKSQSEKIKEMADFSEQTISEWCKQVIVKAANKDNDASLGLVGVGEKILLEQFVLLRILLTNGLIDRELTENKLKRLIKKADEVKSEKASQLIKDFIKDS
jgi:hypothetical protein